MGNQYNVGKSVDKQSKLRGLQRLKWYCQICEKQCRDDNGFKCHTQSPSHQKKVLEAGKDGGKQTRNFSEAFKKNFVDLLRMSHGEKRINANRFYNEFIHDKDHIHMNATRWHSLSSFVRYLGEQNICKVEEIEGEGLTIAYIDKNRFGQNQIKAKEIPDEVRQERDLQKQIERARAKVTLDSSTDSAVGDHILTDNRAPISIPTILNTTLTPRAADSLTTDSAPNNAGIKVSISSSTQKSAKPSGNVFEQLKQKSNGVHNSTPKTQRPNNVFEEIIDQEKGRGKRYR